MRPWALSWWRKRFGAPSKAGAVASSTGTPIRPIRFRAGRGAEGMPTRGILVYPMKGCADGWAGDHLFLAPPFVITEAELDRIGDELYQTLRSTLRDAPRRA